MVWWKSIKERYQMSEWEIVEEITGNASIKVVGVGGGGGNAVQHMVDVGIEGANFISVNTDKQALIINPVIATYLFFFSESNSIDET